MFKKLSVLLALFMLSACSDSDDSLKVGGKAFSENMILSEMVVALAEAEGIPVTQHRPLGPTAYNLENLKSGKIDIYVEYSGTGLVMLGKAALSDGDAVMKKVKSLYKPLGITWGQRLGFSNSHGLAMRANRAAELGISTISDLVSKSGGLVIGIGENFGHRPVDGFVPLIARYGMSFAEVKTVAAKDRMSLYEHLSRGEVDLIAVFTTDGKIYESGLKLLVDDLDFFPAYEAAMIYRSDSLARFPALQTSLNKLNGKLDETSMRKLNILVDQETFTPRDVARTALTEMGLLDETVSTLSTSESIVISTGSSNIGIAESGRVFHAVRKAFPGRHVQLEMQHDPLKSVENSTSVLGLVTAVEFTSFDQNNIPSLRPFEAVGVVGQSYLHIIALDDTIQSLSDVKSLATGPKGSGSYRAGQHLAASMGNLTLRPVEDAFPDKSADAMIVLAPLGSETVENALQNGKLIPINGLGDDNRLEGFPYLRKARIPANMYENQFVAIETLVTQLVLAGPITLSDAERGPLSSIYSPLAATTILTDDIVQTLSKSLAAQSSLDPTIPSARALRPEPPYKPADINPDASVSILNILVIMFIIWLIWLYTRPEAD